MLASDSTATSHGFELQTGVRSRADYILDLECIRGLAILLVFMFHVYGISMGGLDNNPSLPMSFIVSGNTGVTLFFVLSGFLLSRPWLETGIKPGKPAPQLGNFYIARALRVLPLYYFFVLFAALISGNWQEGGRALLFGYVGFEIFPYSVVWWTLSTEIQFYLILPLFMMAWTGSRVMRFAAVTCLAGWLYCYVTFVLLNADLSWDSFLLTKSLFARFPAFLIGIVAAWIYIRSQHWTKREPVPRGARWAALLMIAVAVILLGMVLQNVAVTTDRIAEQSWHIHHTLESILWAAILLLLLLGMPPGKRILVNRPMAITGKLSYSIYLNHVPILFYMVYSFRESMGPENYQASWWLYALPALALGISMALA